MGHGVRSDAVAHGHHRAQRHHAALGVARLEVEDLLLARAERRIGLRNDLIAAAKEVDVVDVHRSEVHLQALEHIGQWHTLALGLGPIDVGIDLRHVHQVVGEHAGDARGLVGRGQEVLQHAVEALVAQGAAVFQLQLEAAQRAHAADRRRLYHADKGIFDAQHFHLQALRDGAGGHVLALALRLRDQRGEDHAAVGSHTEATGHRHAGERDDGIDTRLGADDLAHAARDFARALQRGRIGQLRKGDDIVLVLGGHETIGHAQEAQCTQPQHAGIHHQRDAGHAQDAADAAAIGRRGTIKETIERPEDPARAAFKDAADDVLLFAVWLEQRSGQRRRQRQRVERGDQRGDRDGDGELAIELAGEAAQEGDGNEHRGEHQRDRDDGPADLVHGLEGGIARREARGDVALDVLDHDDGVIDHDADGQHQPEQRQRVDGKASQVQHGEGAHNGHRHGGQRNDGGAPVLQEQHHHQHDQDQRLDQRLDDGLDRVAHEVGRVVDDVVFEPFGEVAGHLVHGRLDVGGQLQGVGARRLEDANGHGRLAVEVALDAVAVAAQLDAGDVLQAGDLAVLARLDDDVFEFGLAGEAAIGVDQQLVVHALCHGLRADNASRNLHVLLADGGDDIARGHAAAGDALRV